MLYYRMDSNVRWEALPKYSWNFASKLTHVKKSDYLNHQVLLETIFQALSSGRTRFKKSYVNSCDYAMGVLIDFVDNKEKHDDAKLGAVALHVATMVQYHFRRLCGTKMRIQINGIKSILETLPKLYPEAAHVCLSNGRLPLHWALEAGKVWDEKSRYRIEIQVLVESYPNGVTMVDPVTGLAPFMMATAAASKNAEASVNTTFRLLQMDPTKVLAYTTTWTQKAKASTKRKRTKKKG